MGHMYYHGIYSKLVIYLQQCMAGWLQRSTGAMYAPDQLHTCAPVKCDAQDRIGCDRGSPLPLSLASGSDRRATIALRKCIRSQLPSLSIGHEQAYACVRERHVVISPRQTKQNSWKSTAPLPSRSAALTSWTQSSSDKSDPRTTRRAILSSSASSAPERSVSNLSKTSNSCGQGSNGRSGETEPRRESGRAVGIKAGPSHRKVS